MLLLALLGVRKPTMALVFEVKVKAVLKFFSCWFVIRKGTIKAIVVTCYLISGNSYRSLIL